MATVRERVATARAWAPMMIDVALVMVGMLAVAIVGLVLDDRVITGVPAWLKPAKFALSGAVYLVALAYMARGLRRTRTLRVVTTALPLVLGFEVVVIFAQAIRGTTSHFNVNTSLDTMLFTALGIGISLVWLMTAVLLWIHLNTPAVDKAMAVALRIGLALNIVAAGVGWTMTQPHPEQLTAMQRGERPFVVGSHTVGAKDGGPMLPLIKWSATHGDLRVPHFVGMHALQALPLLLIGVRGRRGSTSATSDYRLVLGAAAACTLLFVGALLQAWSGHPLIPIAGS
jgi:hypothetical protein